VIGEKRITDSELFDLARSLAPIEAERNSLLMKIGFRLSDILHSGEHGGKYTVLGSHIWECKTSPIAVCIYDHVSDRGHDQCLFCGGPEERK